MSVIYDDKLSFFKKTLIVYDQVSDENDLLLPVKISCFSTRNKQHFNCKNSALYILASFAEACKGNSVILSLTK